MTIHQHTDTPDAPGLSSARRLPVVVGVDEDPRTLAAVDWAAAEAGRRNCPLLLVRASSKQTPWRPDDVLGRAEVRARRVTKGPVEKVLVHGAAPAVLLDQAQDAELLVLGTRGHDPSTTAASSLLALLVARAPCPIVVVDGTRRGRGGRVGVLALVDAEPSTNAVLDWGLDLAARLALPLTAVHAPRDLPGPVAGAVEDDDVLAWLDEDLSRLPDSWDISLTDGLVESARRRHPDVLVHRVLDDVGADSLLSRSEEIAAVLVTDANHSRRLLEVISRGGNAYLTVVVPTVPVPPLADALDVLHTCGRDLREEPLLPEPTRIVDAGARTHQPALVPVHRPAPSMERRLATWPRDRGPRR